MSLAEIEQHIRALPAAERLQFVTWVYSHEDELIESSHQDEISAEVMDELLRRRLDLDSGDVKTFTIEEASARVQEALDEVRHSSH